MPIEFAARTRRIPVYPLAAGYDLGTDVAMLASNESCFAPHPSVVEAAARVLGARFDVLGMSAWARPIDLMPSPLPGNAAFSSLEPTAALANGSVYRERCECTERSVSIDPPAQNDRCRADELQPPAHRV